MGTMAIVTQAESAPAVVRWSARFAKMRGDSLTVIGCLFDQPITAAAPVNLEQPGRLFRNFRKGKSIFCVPA